MVQAVLYGEEIQKCPGFYRGTDQKDFAEKVQGLYNHSVIFLWDWMRLPLLCGKHYRYNSPAPLRRTA